MELASAYHERRKAIGKCKQKASHAVRLLLPGNIWSGGGEFKKVKDVPHLKNAYNYIRKRQEAGTIVWSHRADDDWIKDESVGIVLMAREENKRGSSEHVRLERSLLFAETRRLHDTFEFIAHPRHFFWRGGATEFVNSAGVNGDDIDELDRDAHF